ncbi:MAG TPA: DUF1854 domain-containing protein [Pirellulales bacterium]|nr:DUF1854 domain-containing protein [Pirellulales bacterium]
MSLPSPSQPPLAAGEFHLSNDAWGRLVLIDSQGVRHEGVEPVRAFPLSDPDRWVAICDAMGAELAFVDDLKQLSPAVREALEEALARRDFVPVVERIVRIAVDVDPSEWEVITDRGVTRFLLSGDDGIRRLGEFEAMLIDEHGTRYLISDLRRLDAASRKLLERFL